MTAATKIETLLIASGNQGKVKEIALLLEPLGIHVTSAAQFNVAEPDETESTFKGNALLKARYYSKHTGLPALADDSGLCVDALNGAPGIYSARWAGETKNFHHAMQRIQHELLDKNLETSPASFVCALSLYDPNGNDFTVEGHVHGHLSFPARGNHGFGYDPIFIPEGYDQTFAQMDPSLKHSISHRKKAFDALLLHLKNRFQLS